MNELTERLDDLVKSVSAGPRWQVIAVDRLEETLKKVIRDEVRSALADRDENSRIREERDA